MVVSRADKPAHEDPAIAGLLALLEKGYPDRPPSDRRAVPRRVADVMRSALARDVDIDAEIVGDVAL